MIHWNMLAIKTIRLTMCIIVPIIGCLELCAVSPSNRPKINNCLDSFIDSEIPAP